MRPNQKNWALWLGVLIIITACVFAYITTKPTEADVSSLSPYLGLLT
jgi:uncharacterized membrane protein YhdT